MSAIPDLRGAGRLVLAAACLTLATLAVPRAPTYVFWQISVLVTEAGWILALLALLVLLPGWRSTRTGVVAAMLAALAGGLALSPLARSRALLAAYTLHDPAIRGVVSFFAARGYGRAHAARAWCAR